MRIRTFECPFPAFSIMKTAGVIPPYGGLLSNRDRVRVMKPALRIVDEEGWSFTFALLRPPRPFRFQICRAFAIWDSTFVRLTEFDVRPLRMSSLRFFSASFRRSVKFNSVYMLVGHFHSDLGDRVTFFLCIIARHWTTQELEITLKNDVGQKKSFAEILCAIDSFVGWKQANYIG